MCFPICFTLRGFRCQGTIWQGPWYYMKALYIISSIEYSFITSRCARIPLGHSDGYAKSTYSFMCLVSSLLYQGSQVLNQIFSPDSPRTTSCAVYWPLSVKIQMYVPASSRVAFLMIKSCCPTHVSFIDIRLDCSEMSLSSVEPGTRLLQMTPDVDLVLVDEFVIASLQCNIVVLPTRTAALSGPLYMSAKKQIEQLSQ